MPRSFIRSPKPTSTQHGGFMAVKQMKERGIYEKVPGSGIWWVRYAAADGKEHRELGGKFTDARALVERRRTEKRRGVVPEIRGAPKPSQRYLKFASTGRLSDDLVVWTRTLEGDRWRHSQGCLAACCSLYTTVLTVW